jgi:hypothetical protein
MGRLVAGVISLAVFICGAMYWSQAEQLQTMPQQPLCPGVTCADKTITQIDNAAAVAPVTSDLPTADAKPGCCAGKSDCAPKDCDSKAGCSDKAKASKSGGCCKDKGAKAVDA